MRRDRIYADRCRPLSDNARPDEQSVESSGDLAKVQSLQSISPTSPGRCYRPVPPGVGNIDRFVELHQLTAEDRGIEIGFQQFPKFPGYPFGP